MGKEEAAEVVEKRGDEEAAKLSKIKPERTEETLMGCPSKIDKLDRGQCLYTPSESLCTTDPWSLPGNRDETVVEPSETEEKTAEDDKSDVDFKEGTEARPMDETPRRVLDCTDLSTVKGLNASIERIESAISKGTSFEIPPDLDRSGDSPVLPDLIQNVHGDTTPPGKAASPNRRNNVNKMFDIVQCSIVKDIDDFMTSLGHVPSDELDSLSPLTSTGEENVVDNVDKKSSSQPETDAVGSIPNVDEDLPRSEPSTEIPLGATVEFKPLDCGASISGTLSTDDVSEQLTINAQLSDPINALPGESIKSENKFVEEKSSVDGDVEDPQVSPLQSILITTTVDEDLPESESLSNKSIPPLSSVPTISSASTCEVTQISTPETDKSYCLSKNSISNDKQPTPIVSSLSVSSSNSNADGSPLVVETPEKGEVVTSEEHSTVQNDELISSNEEGDQDSSPPPGSSSGKPDDGDVSISGSVTVSTEVDLEVSEGESMSNKEQIDRQIQNTVDSTELNGTIEHSKAAHSDCCESASGEEESKELSKSKFEEDSTPDKEEPELDVSAFPSNECKESVLPKEGDNLEISQEEGSVILPTVDGSFTPKEQEVGSITSCVEEDNLLIELKEESTKTTPLKEQVTEVEGLQTPQEQNNLLIESKEEPNLTPLKEQVTGVEGLATPREEVGLSQEDSLVPPPDMTDPILMPEDRVVTPSEPADDLVSSKDESVSTIFSKEENEMLITPSDLTSAPQGEDNLTILPEEGDGVIPPSVTENKLVKPLEDEGNIINLEESFECPSSTEDNETILVESDDDKDERLIDDEENTTSNRSWVKHDEVVAASPEPGDDSSDDNLVISDTDENSITQEESDGTINKKDTRVSTVEEDKDKSEDKGNDGSATLTSGDDSVTSPTGKVKKSILNKNKEVDEYTVSRRMNRKSSSFVCDKKSLKKTLKIDRIAEQLGGAQNKKLRILRPKSAYDFAKQVPKEGSKISSAVEILRVDSLDVIRRKPDLTPSVSLIPAEIAQPPARNRKYKQQNSWQNTANVAQASQSGAVMSNFPLGKQCPPACSQLKHLCTSVDMNFRKFSFGKNSMVPNPAIANAGFEVEMLMPPMFQGLPPNVVLTPSQIPSMALPPPPIPPSILQRFGSPLNIPSCFPQPTIPQIIPQPRTRAHQHVGPSNQENTKYVEAFYRTNSGVIKKKYVKVPNLPHNIKNDNTDDKPALSVAQSSNVDNASPSANQPGPTSSNVSNAFSLSNVDVLYTTPTVPPSQTTNNPNFSLKVQQGHKVPTISKSDNLVHSEVTNDNTDSQLEVILITNRDNSKPVVNAIEFCSKEVEIPESVLNLMRQDGNKTETKTDTKTEASPLPGVQREEVLKDRGRLATTTSSLLKLSKTTPTGSEEVVFNSNDLKVILVQPESELHSSKKGSIIPMCESDKPYSSSNVEDGSSRNKCEGIPEKIKGKKKRGSLERVCEKLTTLKNKVGDDPTQMCDIPETIAPSKSPDIVLLPKSVAETEQSTDSLDSFSRMLKVPNFSTSEECTEDAQAFISLFSLGRKNVPENNLTSTSPQPPVSPEPIVVELPNVKPNSSTLNGVNTKSTNVRGRGARSGMVSRRMVRKKQEADNVKKRGKVEVATAANGKAASQPDDEGETRFVLSDVSRTCGGEVNVVDLTKLPPGLSVTVTGNNAGQEQQDAIHRLRRLGTDVSLEDKKMLKNTRGDTVLVTPVDDSEHQPPAIKLLEDMAKTQELPVASPVLTALGRQSVKNKRKSQQNTSENLKPNIESVSQYPKPVEINGEVNQPKAVVDDGQTHSNVQMAVKQPVSSSQTDIVPIPPTNGEKSKAPSVQTLTDVDNQRSIDNETQNPEKCSELLRILTAQNLSESVPLIPEDKVELGVAEMKSADGVFLIRPQHYVKNIEGEQMWCCDICTVACTQLAMFRKHYLRLHISPRFISEKDKEMWNIVDGEGGKECMHLFKCHVCREPFEKKADLKVHLQNHPKKTDEDGKSVKSPKQYICPHCDTSFKWRKPFGKHKKTCQENRNSGKPFHHCLYCNETFFTSYRKKIHILSNHPYTRKKHPCIFCNKIFPSNIILFNHLVAEHSSTFFGCKMCKERFLNTAELRAHYKKLHPTESLKVKNPIMQETDFHQCKKCERVFLVEGCLKKHECLPQNVEKDKEKAVRQKRIKPLLIERKIERSRASGDTDFYSRVSTNIRDNLTYHLDGKLHPVDPPNHVASSHRTILNFNAGVPHTISTAKTSDKPDRKSPNTPTYEKFNFPKEYDGRCGLTSFIKDASYLDISTQLIMRRNLQRLNLLSVTSPDPQWDVPAVLALERLGAQCAESFGTDDPPPSAAEDSNEEGSDGLAPGLGGPVTEGELSGEWVRERTYVCSACSWQSSCLWAMEDHKYTVHPHIWCPQHELNTPNHKQIASFAYQRLIDVPKEEKRDRVSTSKREKYECSKCGVDDFKTKSDLHRHIVECAGEDMVALEAIHNAVVVRLPATKRRPKWRGGSRRTRQGLKRNIPSTPPATNSKRIKKLLRTKPGDADTIEKMIANLPAKRATRRVLGFDEIDIKTRSQATIQNSSTPVVPLKKNVKYGSGSSPPTKKIEKKGKVQGIDTSAENGNVLSSLRMMPVKKNDGENQDVMPTLEIEEDQAPDCDNSEIPVLSPATSVPNPVLPAPIALPTPVLPPSTTAILLLVQPMQPPPLVPILPKKEIKGGNMTLPQSVESNQICGISFVKGKIKYETMSSVEQETVNLHQKRILNVPNPINRKKMPVPQPEQAHKKKRGRPFGSKNKNTLNHVKKAQMKKSVNVKKVRGWWLKEHSQDLKKSSSKKMKGWWLKEISQKAVQLKLTDTGVKVVKSPEGGGGKKRKGKGGEMANVEEGEVMEPESGDSQEHKETQGEDRREDTDKPADNNGDGDKTSNKANEETSPKKQDTGKKRKRKSDNDEEKKLAQNRAEQEKKRKEEEKLRKIEEKKRLDEEKKQKREEIKKIKEAEKKRKEDEKRSIEEEKKLEEEKRKKAEEEERRKKEIEEEERKRKEEGERRKLVEVEEERKRKEEELKRRTEEEEIKRKEEELKRKEEDAKKKKDEEMKRKEEEKKRKEEEVKKKREEEAKKKKDDEMKRKEEEKKRKEEEAKKKKDDEAKKKKEEEVKKKKEEEAKKKKEDEAKKKKDEEIKRKEEEVRKKKEEGIKRKEEEECTRREQELRKREEEAKKQAEEEKRRKEQDERKRIEEEGIKIKEEEEEEEKLRLEEDQRKKCEEENRKKMEVELKRIMNENRNDSINCSAKSPLACDTEDPDDDTDSQKSFKTKKRRKHDLLKKLNRLSLVQKMRRKKMMMKMNNTSGGSSPTSATSKEVVSSGMKWEVEVSQEEQQAAMDWLNEVPPVPTIKAVPTACLMADQAAQASSSDQTPPNVEPMWRSDMYQSPNLGSILDSVNTNKYEI